MHSRLYRIVSLCLLGWLSVHSSVVQWMFDQQWHRGFYLVSLLASVGVVNGLYASGNLVFQALARFGLVRQSWVGLNWLASVLLGVALFGNLAFVGSLLVWNQPWLYQGVFLALSLLASLKCDPRPVIHSLKRIWRHVQRSGLGKWIWGLGLLMFVARYLVSVLPIQGTEQLHNTLPYAKYFFSGIDFWNFNVDNHFLLLGIYESFGLYLLALTGNVFAYQILGQSVTFLIVIGGMTLALATYPVLLRKWPQASALLALWPAAINFAATDTIAFKPDWLAILSMAVATVGLFQLWARRNHPFAASSHSPLWGIMIFSGIAASCKLTALNYALFILPLSLALVWWRDRKPAPWLKKAVLCGVLFVLAGSGFFVKNSLWLHNPVFPGFQSIFPKPERLEQTSNFNTFKIHRITQKIPQFEDYIRGYTQFVEPQNHPEFLVVLALAAWMAWRRRKHMEILGLLGLYLAFFSLICIQYYPGLYQRYVAYVYIILISLCVLVWLHFKDMVGRRWQLGALTGFALLTLTHANLEGNLGHSSRWWLQGESVMEYRIKTDPITHFFLKINQHCKTDGVILNRKWRSFLYADLVNINMTDLPGDAYSAAYLNQHRVQFVILTTDRLQGAEFQAEKQLNRGFFQDFQQVESLEDVHLWKRKTLKCAHEAGWE